MNSNTKIIGGALARNEASRWLKEFIEFYNLLCDEIFVIDDNSTDDTVKMFEEYSSSKCDIRKVMEHTFENNESILRSELWDLCSKKASIGDWIVIFDCDEIISHVEACIFREILLQTPSNIELFGLKLYDMWNKTHYRYDKLWNAHTRVFPFATRYNIQQYTFNQNKLHCGRFPQEALYKQCGYTENIRVKHLGWSLPHERQLKYERYMRTDKNGKYGSLEQYESILDVNPNLVLFEDSFYELKEIKNKDGDDKE